jgi:beta-lactamase regulating signal transducer with metallopeptidase domain
MISHLCAQLLRFLAEPALRALALAALAGLALAAGRVKDAATRLAVWTAVLYAALAMPFLVWIAPAVRLPIPALRTTASAPPPATADIKALAAGSPVRFMAGATPSARLPSREPHASRWTSSWPLAAAVLYVLIAGVLLARVAVAFLFSRRIKFSCRPVDDRRVRAALVEQSARGGLETAPEVAESPAIAVPVTLRVWRPTILLPATWRTWGEEKIQAVLAHEMSHVVRKDALTRALAAIHRAVFWFSPLGWWLERRLATLAEQASDDAALRALGDHTLYAKVLLGFYQDMQGAVGRVRWEGMAMASGKQALRRVDRILDSTRPLAAGLKKGAWLPLALLAAPVVYLLAGVQPVAAKKAHAEDARMLAGPLASPAAQPVGAGMQASTAPQAPPAPAAAPQAPTPPRTSGDEWLYGNTGEVWLLTNGQSLSMTGTFQHMDVEHFRELRRASNADFIWFRHNGKAYFIRDAATVRQAQGFFAGQDALGKQQDELGRQQEELGAQQEELGKQMESVRVQVPDLTAEIQKLQAQLDRLHRHGATQGELGELQSALGDLQGKLGDLQSKAGERQSEIAVRQAYLGARQSKLGERQGKLGEQQGRLAEEASRKMRRLLDNALAKGLAQPE